MAAWMIELSFKLPSQLTTIRLVVIQSKQTHKLYTFIFYFLLYVSVIHNVHQQVEKYRSRTKTATEEASTAQPAKNTLDIPKRRKIKWNNRNMKINTFCHKICTKIQTVTLKLEMFLYTVLLL